MQEKTPTFWKYQTYKTEKAENWMRGKKDISSDVI